MKIRFNSVPNLRYMILISALIYFIFLNIDIPDIFDVSSDEVITFNEGWRISIESVVEELEPLPVKKEIIKGTSFSIINTLPQIIEENMVMSLRSSYQHIEVFVDNKSIYTYGSPTNSIYTKYPPNSFLYIPLQKNYGGKEVRIEISSNHPIYSGTINGIIFGNEKDCINYNFNSFRNRFFFLSTFVVLGIIIFIVSFVIRHQNLNLLHYSYFGIFSVFIAIWIITSTNMLQQFTGVNYETMYLCFFCLMFLPFPYLLFLRGQMNNPIYIYSLDIIFFIFVINFLLTSALSLMGLVHFFDVYVITVLLIGFGLIANIVIVLFSITNDNRFDLIPIFLFSLILMVTFIIEIFLYYNFTYNYEIFGKILLVGLSIYIYGVCLINLIFIGKELEQSYIVKEQLAQNKLTLMLSQIQPHFIYNTLDAIRILIKKEPDKAYNMIYDFSKHLRNNINSMSEQDVILFSDELKNITAYTNIETIRFPEISIIFDIEVEDFYVPTLTIQPLVENAIRHGVSKKFGAGMVTIKTYEERDCYRVEIIDTGIGFDVFTASYNKDSVGLKNIKLRLQKLSGAFIDIHSVIGEGTRVLVTFPKSFNRRDIDENYSC